jgi:hypothetical protein
MSTELFPEAEMPFNLISQTIAAPVKILSPREEEAARAATVRAGGYENTPSMFDAQPVDESIKAPIPHGWAGEMFESFGNTYKRAVDLEGFVWYWSGQWVLNVPYFDSITNSPLPENIHGRRLGRITQNGTLVIGKRRIDSSRWNH